jgi:hypothetical protein
MPADPGATRRRRRIGPAVRAVLTAAALVTAHHLLDGSAPGSFSESPTTSTKPGRRTRRQDHDRGEPICDARVRALESQSATRVPELMPIRHLGDSDRFDCALSGFAQSCADQNERDFEALKAARRSGRIRAQRL